MTQPLSFKPLRGADEKRIAPMPPAARSDAAQPITVQTRSSVSLSKLTEVARRLASEGPPVDNVRIAQISQAIANGGYRINAEAIAEAILRQLPATSR